MHLPKALRFKTNSRAIPLFAILFLILLAVLFATSTYHTQLKIYRDNELAKLQAIVNTLVTQLDGNAHESLTSRYLLKDEILSNEQDSVYLKLHRQLKDAKESNNLETTMYTSMYDSSKHKFCLLVNSEDHPFWKHPNRDFPDKLLADYHIGGVIEPYKDPNGYWLSAFASIKNDRGKTVGVVQADQRFDAFIKKVEDQVYRNILLSLAVVSVLSAFLIVNLRSLLKKEDALRDKSLELDRLRKELIANVSHDLRTPLASIQGYLETIAMKGERLEKIKLDKYIKITLDNAAKLGSLIDELFELSKLESGDRKIKLEEFSIRELLSDNANAFRPAAMTKNIEIEVMIESDGGSIRADRPLIDRAVNNLLSNAVKFTPEGGKVTLSWNETKERITVFVTDSGPGIPGDDPEMVFRRLYTASEHAGGSGLGLAIVKSIVQAHGGEFGVRNRPEGGAEFFFRLPLSK